MGQANARAIRYERLAEEREEKITDRTMALALMAAFLYPSQGEQAIDTASFILDDARRRAEQDVPEVA